MIKLEIVSGSLKISKGGIVILLVPKDSCAIDVLDLDDTIPKVNIYNKYLANLTVLFVESLSNCVDSTNTPFTKSSFINFAETNLGF